MLLFSEPACLPAYPPADLLTWGEGQPEPEVAAPGVGRVVVPKRRPAVPGNAAPAAAPKDTVRACRGSPGISHGARRIIPVPVPAPLPDVPVHVVQSPVIGLQLPDRMGRTFRIRTIPRILGEFAFIVSKTVSRIRTSPRRIFPLGFRGQAVFVRAFLPVQLLYELSFQETRSTGQLLPQFLK